MSKLERLETMMDELSTHIYKEYQHATLSSNRGSFNHATRKYWAAKAEAYGDLLTGIVNDWQIVLGEANDSK